MKNFPAELTDHIIDFHHSDKQTLKVCSLVCRNWLPASRFHLVGSLRIYPTNAHSFAELLDTPSPSPSIAGHVHTLYIYLHYQPEVFDAIAPHFEKFVALNCLSLRSAKWIPISGESLSKGFGRVENMELTEISYNFNIPWTRLTFTIGESSSTSGLRALHTALDGADRLSWLPRAAQFPSVCQLDISRIYDRNLPTVQSMLKSGGQSVHTIKLNFSDSASVIDSVDLSHNTNLRSLSILDLRLWKNNQTAGITKFIQQISFPSFSHLELGMWCSDNVDSDQTWRDLRKIGNELNHPRFSELKKVCVAIWGNPVEAKKKMAAQVHREMSCLDNRGILYVHI